MQFLNRYQDTKNYQGLNYYCDQKSYYDLNGYYDHENFHFDSNGKLYKILFKNQMLQLQLVLVSGLNMVSENTDALKYIQITV